MKGKTMAKRQTVRFYSEQGEYHGWAYLNKASYQLEIIPWLNKFGKVLVDEHVITLVNKDIFILNSYYYSLIKQ
jgi:hypothetical protein